VFQRFEYGVEFCALVRLVRAGETGGEVVWGVWVEEYSYSGAAGEEAVGGTGAVCVDYLGGGGDVELGAGFGVFGDIGGGIRERWCLDGSYVGLIGTSFGDLLVVG